MMREGFILPPPLDKAAAAHKLRSRAAREALSGAARRVGHHGAVRAATANLEPSQIKVNDIIVNEAAGHKAPLGGFDPRGRKGKAIAFVTPEQGELLDKVEQLTNVEVPEIEYPDFKVGPEPDKVRQAREKSDAAISQTRETKSRSKVVAPDKESGADTSKFPGGIVPVAAPKKRMGGRLRTRRS